MKKSRKARRGLLLAKTPLYVINKSPASKLARLRLPIDMTIVLEKAYIAGYKPSMSDRENMDNNDKEPPVAAADGGGNAGRKFSSRHAVMIAALLLLIASVVVVYYNISPKFIGWEKLFNPTDDNNTSPSADAKGERAIEAREIIKKGTVTTIADRPPPATKTDADLTAEIAQMESAVAELRQRLTVIEQVVEQLRRRSFGGDDDTTNAGYYGPFVADINNNTGSNDNDRDNISSLQQRVQKLENSNIADEISVIKSSISSLNTQAMADSYFNAIRLLLALDRLENSLASGLPYGKEINEITTMLAADSEAILLLEQLREYAGNGVPQHQDLQREVVSLLHKTIKAVKKRDSSIGGRISGALSSVISIRKIGSKPGDDGVIERLQYMITLAENGQIGAILVELQQIDDAEIKDMFADWRQRAEFAVSLPHTISDLRNSVHSMVIAATANSTNAATLPPATATPDTDMTSSHAP